MITRQTGLSARRKRGRAAKVLLVAILFAGLFLQIGMLARISGQSKKIASVSREIVELNARRENLALSLSMLKNPDQIEALALKLGMQRPDEGAIRVVNLPAAYEDTQTLTAGMPGAEGVVR